MTLLLETLVYLSCSSTTEKCSEETKETSNPREADQCPARDSHHTRERRSGRGPECHPHDRDTASNEGALFRYESEAFLPQLKADSTPTQPLGPSLHGYHPALAGFLNNYFKISTIRKRVCSRFMKKLSSK